MINEHQVIVIKDDDESEDCNHRISYLRSQRFCQRNAKLCRQICVACQKHGNPNLKKEHTNISVDDFYKAFTALQETFSKETQHYIRQMNETQSKAIEAIRKKKQECFGEIQQLKVHLMKKTYRTLQQKYPTLYQKFKNKRLDAIKCCQVFWVINTSPVNHQLKHSEVNKKLEAILKKFENFKEVSRNINSQNIFNNKERIKKSKISEKISKPPEQLQRVEKEDIKIDREKVNFYNDAEEKYKREIDKLSRELASFRERKKNAQEELRRLDYEIRHFNNLRLTRIRRLDIVNTVISYHSCLNNKVSQQFQYIRSQLLQQSAVASKKVETQRHPEIQGSQRQYTSQEHHSEEQMLEEQLDKSQQHIKEKEVSPEKQNQQIASANNHQEKEPKTQLFQPNQRQVHSSSQEEFSQAEQSFEDNLPEQQEEIAQQQAPIQSAQQAPMPTPRQAPFEAKVKIEQSSAPFEAWKNEQLLSQMRTYGKRIQHALKVEDIDLLSNLPFITPPKNLFKLTPQKQSELTSKPTTFSMMADKLFMKYNQSKKGQDKDKDQ